MAHVSPSVRLIAEGSGDLIGHLPNDAPALATDDEVLYEHTSGSPAVTYKIEKVLYVAEYANVTNPVAPDSYSVYGRTDYIVSVVP